MEMNKVNRACTVSTTKLNVLNNVKKAKGGIKVAKRGECYEE